MLCRTWNIAKLKPASLVNLLIILHLPTGKRKTLAPLARSIEEMLDCIFLKTLSTIMNLRQHLVATRIGDVAKEISQ